MNCQHIRQGMAKNSEIIRLGRLHSVQCWLSAAIHSLSVSSKWAIQEVLSAVLLTIDSSYFLALQRASSSSHRAHWVSANFAEKRSTSRPHKKNTHSAMQKNIKECMRSALDEYMNICFRQWRHLVYTCEWSKAGQGWTGAFWWNRFERIDQMAWQTFFIPLILPCFLASLLDLASEQDEQVPPKAVLPPRDSETHVSQKLPGMHLCAWWRLWLLKAANRDFIMILCDCYTQAPKHPKHDFSSRTNSSCKRSFHGQVTSSSSHFRHDKFIHAHGKSR